MSEPTCYECRYWDKVTSYPDKRNSGLCRIHPPVRNDTDNDDWGWPVTYDEDWCGEWVQLVRSPELPRKKRHDPVFPSEEQYWRSRGDSEEDIALRIAVRGRA
jgi:hypothetical protein